MKYILDTSALLAHLQREAGAEIVNELVENHHLEVAISAMTWLEFIFIVRRSASDSSSSDEVIASYRSLLGPIVPVSATIAEAAADLRLECRGLHASDSIIAATAKLAGAVLVHRDALMREAISDNIIKQLVLPPKGEIRPGK